MEYYQCNCCNNLSSFDNSFRVFYLDTKELDWKIYCNKCLAKITRPHVYINVEYYPYVDHYDKEYEIRYVSNDDPDLNKDGHGLRFGVEFELDCGGTDPILAGLVLSQFGFDFAICDLDASLEDGIEIDTFPITWKQYQEEFRSRIIWALKFASMAGYSTPDTCGMHIHISREYIDVCDRLKFDDFLTFFFYKYREELLRISGREDESTFCMFPDSEKSDYSSRYRAVNLISTQNTIEFRFFSGSMNIGLISARIEFCLALIRFAKECCYVKSIINNNSFLEIVDSMMNISMHCRATIHSLLRLSEKREIVTEDNIKTVSRSRFNESLRSVRARFNM